MLSRLLRRAKTVVGDVPGLSRGIFVGHPRSSRRLAQQVHRLARRKGEAAAEEMRSAYQRVAAIGQQTCAQATRVRGALADQADSVAHRLMAQIDQFLPLVQQAIDQAVRRVLGGESVPATEKIVSLFEPHTQIIQRHQAGRPVEFGRKLWVEEVAGGLVSGYRLLPEAGQDHAYLAESLADHQRRFGHPPWLLAGDRGVSSPTNEVVAQQAGVQWIALPATGKVSAARQTYERTPQFRRADRFRAGVEGRIRVLQRDFGLDRCPDHGADGMGRWVGWGVLTHNLAKIAQTVGRRTAARQGAASQPTPRAARAA